MRALLKPVATAFTALLALLVACSGQASDTKRASPAKAYQPVKYHRLALIGYNYTDRYIDSFTVNGQGGGNLSISTPTSGGGSMMCCVGWMEGSELPKKITVKWVGSYCTQRLFGREGPDDYQDLRQSIWKTADIQFNGPVPRDPENFEVHFYPDGTIEAAMTRGYSPPRLQLPAPPNRYVRPGKVVNDPPCPPGYDSLQASLNPERVNAIRPTVPSTEPQKP